MKLLFSSLMILALFSCSDSTTLASGPQENCRDPLAGDRCARYEQEIVPKAPPERNRESICEYRGAKVSCSSDEQDMIDGINKMINHVEKFDPATLKTDFVQVAEGSDPVVFMFGESHTDTFSQVKTLGAINSLARKKDVFLLEGGDPSQIVDQKDCALEIIYSMYIWWQYAKYLKMARSFGSSNIMSSVKFFNSKNFYQNRLVTAKSYDFSSLNIGDLECGYWDDTASLAKDSTRFTLKKRNSVMVDTIKDWLSRGYRVFLTPGYRHMPLGDFILEQSNPAKFIEDFQQNEHKLSDFYAHSKLRKKIMREEGYDISGLKAGSTKNIYRLLSTLPNVQYIYRGIINDPNRDF